MRNEVGGSTGHVVIEPPKSLEEKVKLLLVWEKSYKALCMPT